MLTWISKSDLKLRRGWFLNYSIVSVRRQLRISCNYAKGISIRIKLVIRLDMKGLSYIALSKMATFRLVISQRLQLVSHDNNITKPINI